MQTLSSARRTCIASASAVEWTATVGMPSSRQARWMRTAISPRLTIRIFWNNASFQDHQGLAVLDRRSAGDQDPRHRAGPGGADLVEGLHRLDEQQGLAGGDALAEADEDRGAGLGRQIGDAHHRA